jgi:hypothetical protein
MRKISFAVLLIPALVWAAPNPRTADDWYDEGANQYTLGNFDKAIDAFKQGFSLEPDESKKANYLYNIAQAYRQTHDCKNAVFFYRRFLALKANDTAKPIPTKKRKQVEDFIAELDACVRQQTNVSQKPPVNNVPPDGEKGEASQASDSGRKDSRKEVATSAPGTVEPSDTGEEDDGGSVMATGGAPARLISLRIDGGATKVTAGSIPVPVQATFALVGGYPIPVNDKLTVEVGAAFTFTPVPVDVKNPMQTMMTSETAQLWGLLANVGATYEVYPQVGLRGDLGLGALLFANAGYSAFTDYKNTTGALSMFHVRAAVSADYAVTPNLVITATPVAFTYSPKKAGLSKDVDAITSLDFMIGVGYRM